MSKDDNTLLREQSLSVVESSFSNESDGIHPPSAEVIRYLCQSSQECALG